MDGGTPFSHADQESSVPGGITVQIISDPSVLQNSSSLLQGTGTILQTSDGQLITSIPSAMYPQEDPGVAQTLLNISQPEIIDSVKAGVITIPQVGTVEGVSSAGDSQKIKVEEEDVALEEEKRRVAEDIRQQIRELCNQLADVGEESFLVSVRVHDGAFEHLGSIKGDHYCLLRQEMLQDFHDFCLGIESDGKDEDDEEENSKLNSTLYENSVDNEEDEEEDMEVEESDKPKDENKSVSTAGPCKINPKVIVLRKDADGKKVSVDHQYTVKDKQGQGAAVAPTVVKVDGDGKENKKTNTNILFLCDLCKNVFNDIKELRAHKLEVHQESDYKCDQCSRVFSLKKTHERHMMDAHNPEEDKILCDTCVLDFTSKEDLEEHIKKYHNNDLPMKCDICEQTFPDITKLMDHRKIHFDYDCFCHICWQGFFDYLELETHVQSSCRYKEALYKCDVCGKKYTKLAAINKHIDTHPIHSPHVCRMCGRGFESEKDLKYHRTAAHIIRPFKCEFCEKTFKKKESLTEHRRIHLRVKIYTNGDGTGRVPMIIKYGKQLKEDDPSVSASEFECPTCGIVLPSQGTLDQHIHQHETATEQHQCDRCDKVFFSHSLLTVHCRKEHKIFLSSREDQNLITTDLLVCEWEGCNKTFYDRNKWKYHMKYHEQRADKIARGIPLTPKVSATTCDICGKVLKYKSYLKAHMLTHSNEQPHQCEICGQSYSNSKRLADHIRVHKGERPFKCRVCEKSFTSTSLRNQHMVVHWGHKTYICDVCGKGFMSRKHFHDHMRIHNGEQPHKCETCGKDFIYYRSLVRHALTHIDMKERAKPYKCQYCGKEYTEVTGYKHHLRSVHTGETPFQCDICGDAFHRNDKLKRHMKSRHNQNDQKMSGGMIVTTRRSTPQGAPIFVKADTEPRNDLLQIVADGEGMEGQNELHVDVIQEGGPQQVFLIGLGNEGGEATYLQETQVIEGPDGVRYIIAGSGEELQVIESANMQQYQEGEVVDGDIIQTIQQVQQDGDSVMVMNDGQTFTADQETLATLANMASVAEVADIVKQE